MANANAHYRQNHKCMYRCIRLHMGASHFHIHSGFYCNVFDELHSFTLFEFELNETVWRDAMHSYMRKSVEGSITLMMTQTWEKRERERARNRWTENEWECGGEQRKNKEAHKIQYKWISKMASFVP